MAQPGNYTLLERTFASDVATACGGIGRQISIWCAGATGRNGQYQTLKVSKKTGAIQYVLAELGA